MNDTSPALSRPHRLVAYATVAALAAAGLTYAAATAVPGAVAEEAEPALDWTNYEKITLSKDVGEPVDMAVLPDGRVLTTARNGDVRLVDGDNGTTTLVNHIDVYANSEDGLQTIALDPDFEENGYVYVVYSPLDADGDGVNDTPTGSAPDTLPAGADDSYWDQWLGVNRLSRYVWTGETLDLSTEQVILDIEVNRGQCCHVGADIAFDGDGNLYLSTGDNTPSGAGGSGGYAPINDAEGRNPGNDARRSAGNTNDLRGKILRIHVEEDGSYTIPEGNLFEPGTEGTRAEIFVMGVRNPFRISVDIETNTLTWGDYGPDAQTAEAGRGPMGYVEWNITSLDDPHNSGWPYYHGNAAYNDWNFETSTTGTDFDPQNLKNESRWNTGLVDLPDAREATAWYGRQAGQQPWDEFVNFGSGTGAGPHGGPTYRYEEGRSDSQFPEYWDGKAFLAEFSQDYIAAISVDYDTLEVTGVEDFMPNAQQTYDDIPPIDNPMDIEFGPDGSLYVLDYGDGFFRANPDAGLYKISYAEGNKSPQAAFTATPDSSSTAPLPVEFDASSSTDPDGDALTFEWDFDGDGVWDGTGVTASYTYEEFGLYTPRLRVTDPSGKSTLTSVQVSVGNQAPEVTLEYPAEGAFFEWGDRLPFSVTTNDAEDGTATVCSNVSWTWGLGHDTHAHPEVSGTGCSGTFNTNASAADHGEGAYLYGVAVISYKDQGANGVASASGEVSVVLNHKTLEAEFAAELSGVTTYADESADSGRAIRGLDNGDYLKYEPVNFVDIDSAIVRATGDGEVELRWNDPAAEPFAVATIPGGSGWKDVEVSLDGAPEGTGVLYVTSADALAVDSVSAVGSGVADAEAPAVSHTLTPSAPTGVGGVYNEAVRLAVAATDNAALQSVQYSLNGGTSWTNLAANQQYSVTFSTNGTYDVTYRATDTSGNVSEIGSVSFTIDLDAPNEPTVDTSTIAGVASPRVTYGDPGTVDVQVSTQDQGVPAGEVVLTVGDEEVGRGTLDAEGKASIALATDLAVGSHTIRASYIGDETFKPSAVVTRLTVSQAKSTVSATVSPNPVKPAVAAQVAISVTSNSGIAPAGTVTVTVKKSSSTVATVTGTLDAEGNVTVTLPKLSTTGTYQVVAAYDGSAGVGKNSATVTLKVAN